MWCYFDAFLTFVELKNFKQAMTEPSWIDAMQEEIHEFERLEVWELVPCLDKVFLIKLQWIYKSKTDEFGRMTTKFKMSMIGKMSFFLGLQISQCPKGIFINRSKYATKIVKKYGMHTTNSVDTPMLEKIKLDEDLQENQLMLHYTVA
nr:uncharacterized mitochondrial protein AtMg00810-like [Tanacetum cinerariifolium]